jgi:hypothetical protein
MGRGGLLSSGHEGARYETWNAEPGRPDSDAKAGIA